MELFSDKSKSMFMLRRSSNDRTPVMPGVDAPGMGAPIPEMPGVDIPGVPIPGMPGEVETSGPAGKTPGQFEL